MSLQFFISNLIEKVEKTAFHGVFLQFKYSTLDSLIYLLWAIFYHDFEKWKTSEENWPDPGSQRTTGSRLVSWKRVFGNKFCSNFINKLCCDPWCLLNISDVADASGHGEHRSYSPSWMWDRSSTQRLPGPWERGCQVRTSLCSSRTFFTPAANEAFQTESCELQSRFVFF